METELAAQPTEITEQTTTEQQDSSSIADHESQFGPVERRRADTDTDGQADTAPQVERRHRASSQQATKDDVDAIAQLTKRLRAAEADLGIEQKPGESQRVYNLRRQAETAERLREMHKQPAKPATPKTVDAPTVQQFTEKEPVWDDYINDADPVTAFNRAWAKYDRAKDAFDAKQAEVTERQAAQNREQIDAYNANVAAHAARVQEFIKTKPDFEQVCGKMDELGEIPPLLGTAIISDDKSAELMYSLANQPEKLSELILLTYGKPVTPQSVALTQRRLRASNASSAAVTTGAAPATPSAAVTFRPPTPVRTGPLKTADQPLADDASISEHEKRFGPKRR